MPILLQIDADGNRGSTGKIAEIIGNLVMARGWISYIVHGRDSRPSQSEIIKMGSIFDIYNHGLKTRLFDKHGLGSYYSTKKLIEQIRIIKPDVIQLHNLHGYYLNIEVLFNYLSKTSIPVIWTFHDCWAITGHCAHFDYVGCDKWKTECYDCPQKFEYPASWIIDRSKENYRMKKEIFNSISNLTIVSVSNWLNGIVNDSFLGHHPKKVIYNGIDIDIFNPKANRHKVREKLNIENKFIILGVAGIWPKQKGLSDFIKLSDKIGENDIIILVGLSNSQIKGLPHNIIGIPRTESQEELKDLYATSDVFLNLSVEETFGLTTAEALACGTPAIVYNSTACPELIDKKTGIIVKRNDIDALLNSIEIIKMNKRSFYSFHCRERAVEKFNKNEQFSEYIKLYEKLIQEFTNKI